MTDRNEDVQPAEREDREVRAERREDTPLFARELEKPLKVKTGLKGGIIKRCADYG
jgi:hypothetical protein